MAQPRKRASEFKVLTPKLGSRSLQAGKPRSLHRHRNISVPCLALRGSRKSVPCIPFKKRKSTWVQYHHQGGQGRVMLNWLEIIQTFMWVFLRLIRHFGGYFQWKACTNFQKICSWARYTDAKLIKNNSNF